MEVLSTHCMGARVTLRGGQGSPGTLAHQMQGQGPLLTVTSPRSFCPFPQGVQASPWSLVPRLARAPVSTPAADPHWMSPFVPSGPARPFLHLPAFQNQSPDVEFLQASMSPVGRAQGSPEGRGLSREPGLYLPRAQPRSGLRWAPAGPAGRVLTCRWRPSRCPRGHTSRRPRGWARRPPGSPPCSP